MYGAASRCDGIQGLALDMGKIGVFTAQGKGGSKRGIWQTNGGGVTGAAEQPLYQRQGGHFPEQATQSHF